MKVKNIYYLIVLIICMSVLYGCSKQKGIQAIKPVIEAYKQIEPVTPLNKAAPAEQQYILYYVGTWETDRACLWNISIEMYGTPERWPDIYQANSDIISDQDLIYPQQLLKIPVNKAHE